jgi:hypothetical protein
VVVVCTTSEVVVVVGASVAEVVVGASVVVVVGASVVEVVVGASVVDVVVVGASVVDVVVVGASVVVVVVGASVVDVVVVGASVVVVVVGASAVEDVIEYIIEPSARQIKILNALGQLNEESKANVLMIKFLNNCLIDDYKGLIRLIDSANNISLEFKGIYISLCNRFIDSMIKKCNSGETMYQNKCINQIVINLTL